MKNNTETTAHGAGDGAENLVCKVRFQLPPKPPLRWASDYVGCPRCRGFGMTSAALVEFSCGRSAVYSAICLPCGGRGVVDLATSERIRRGERFRRKRLSAYLTLRECAKLISVSAQWLSAAESGTVKNDILGELQKIQLDLNPAPFNT